MIEVGEYVRDRDGLIIRVKDIVPDEDSDDIWYEEKILNGTWKSMIVKHSKNLIDLIETGDYVNGSKVVDIMEDMKTEEIHLEMTYDYTNEELGDCTIYNKDIKSIITHEQFKSIEYRVETEEKK